jgi:alpha-galactosidase
MRYAVRRFPGLSVLVIMVASSQICIAAAEQSYEWKSCRASLRGQTFTIGNALVKRSPNLEARPFELDGDARGASEWTWLAVCESGRDLPVEAEALVATLTGVQGNGRQVRYRFRVFEGVPAIEWRRIAEPGTTVQADAVIERFLVEPGVPHHFTAVHLQDHTDRHGKKDNLVRTTRRALNAEPFTAAANLAYVENEADGKGTLFVKLAPLPHARAVRIDHDFSWDGKVLTWYGPGVNPVSGQGYACAVVTYSGGRAGRIAALQDYYRCLRNYDPERDGLLLSNTWGDRSRDAKIAEAFLVSEVEAGKSLGIDVMEVDDGWQKGTTQNSATVTRSKAGVWSGFWRTDSEFWTPHPERLPNGLTPVAVRAKEAGLHLGLWYAPDSENGFANWKRDAERILCLHREHGVDYFKLDSITMTSPEAECNVRRMLDRVTRESGGRIVVDLDVTAGVRPGYLGAVASGTVFVENRYTDWGNYWPHQTLRNFWSLAEHVDPVRLRMEFLNNMRRKDKYKGKGELVPAAYPPAYLFASVMFGSPLAWFEVSELPEAYAREVGALVQVWRQHRAALQSGHIIPIGDEPDGHQWTGFASVARDRRSGYVLALRETNDREEWRVPVPLVGEVDASVELLAGDGQAAVQGGQFTVRVPQPRSFAFVRFEVK